MAVINSCEVIEFEIKTSLTKKKIYLAKKRSPRTRSGYTQKVEPEKTPKLYSEKRRETKRVM